MKLKQEYATYYINMSTGELTEAHAEAVEWYRSGSNVMVEKYLYTTTETKTNSLEWIH